MIGLRKLQTVGWLQRHTTAMRKLVHCKQALQCSTCYTPSRNSTEIRQVEEYAEVKRG